MKKVNLFLIALSLVAIIGTLGCAALSHYITPAEIDHRAVEYAAEAGVADVNDFAGYGNLYKAVKLEKAVQDAYQLNQLDLAQLAEENDLKFAQLNNVTMANRKAASEKEEQLFGEKGLLTMGLGLIGFGGLGGMVGLMRKRPGDVTPEELKQALGGSEAKLTEKEQQFAELVKGIQKVIDKQPDNKAEQMKNELAKAQSQTTKEAVALIKAKA